MEQQKGKVIMDRMEQIEGVIARSVDASLARVGKVVDAKEFSKLVRLNFNAFLEFADAASKLPLLDAVNFPVDVFARD